MPEAEYGCLFLGDAAWVLGASSILLFSGTPWSSVGGVWGISVHLSGTWWFSVGGSGISIPFSGTLWSDVGGIAIVGEVFFRLSPEGARGGRTERGRQTEEDGVGKQVNGETFVLSCKILSHLDEVGVGAVFQQVENVLAREATVWAGVGIGVPSFGSVKLAPEGS